MAKLLLGKEVTDALNANLQSRTAALREKGVVPTLGIVRIGADPSDLSYEKGATKRAELVAARQETASLEKVRERKHEEYRYQIQKSEELFIEELVASQWRVPAP